jgi:diguanylate cyclase (GGDEF)-like protein
MKLFNQMGLAVSFIILTMLASVMVISYQSTKQDMIQGVYETSVNNISTLANSLAQTQGEKAHITTIVDAAFDSGYYKLIEYAASEGEFSYKQEFQGKPEGVPEWFFDFADIKIAPLEESVVVGWETLGSVKVLGDISIVYKSLYQTLIKLFYLFMFFAFVSLVLLSIMLSFILKPLREIQHQAEAITRDEFVFQENIPYTTEFKEVVRAMNMMVKKVEYIFIKGSETFKRNQELLYNDPVTQLYNRRYLLLKLPDLVTLENRANGGTIFFAALKGAESLNQSLGRATTDKLFESLGDVFLRECKKFEDGIAARMNGTEFTLVLPNCEASEGLEVAQAIHTYYEKLLLKYGVQKESTTLDIGMYRYRPNVNISELLIRADSALAHAKADESSNTYIYEEHDDENAMGKEQWRSIIEESISQKHVRLKFWPMVETREAKAEHTVMTFTLDDTQSKQYFYGDFIAPAINLGLVSKIYMVALEDLITNKHHELTNRLCCVRLSNEFIKDPHAFEALASLLKQYTKELKFKLFFEISDGFIIKNPMLVRRFLELFKLYGCGFGINAFASESDDFSYLKEFNPSFIKADVSFLLDQSKDSMMALQVITDSLGVRIIATSVTTQEQLDGLLSLGVSRIQGPLTQSITL